MHGLKAAVLWVGRGTLILVSPPPPARPSGRAWVEASAACAGGASADARPEGLCLREGQVLVSDTSPQNCTCTLHVTNAWGRARCTHRHASAPRAGPCLSAQVTQASYVTINSSSTQLGGPVAGGEPTRKSGTLSLQRSRRTCCRVLSYVKDVHDCKETPCSRPRIHDGPGPTTTDCGTGTPAPVAHVVV